MPARAVTGTATPFITAETAGAAVAAILRTATTNRLGRGQIVTAPRSMEPRGPSGVRQQKSHEGRPAVASVRVIIH